MNLVELPESENNSTRKIGLRPAALEILKDNKYFFVIGEMIQPSTENRLIKFNNSTAFWTNQLGEFQQITNLPSFQCLKLIPESETIILNDKVLSNEK